MTGLRVVEGEGRDGQGPGLDTSLRSLSQQASAIEYDAAQQLVQHAQEGRLKRTADLATLQNYGNSGGFYQLVNADQRERTKAEYDLSQQEHSSQGVSPESTTDTQYPPVSNSPAMGQMCR